MHGLVCSASKIGAEQGVCSIAQTWHTMSGGIGCTVCHAQPLGCCRTHIS